MTMIAYASGLGAPLLIGDLLVSSPIKASKFGIPALGGYNALEIMPSKLELYPFQMYQKIYVIKDTLCLAFAGSLFECKTILEDFKIFCNYFDQVEEDQILEFARTQNLDKRKDVSFIFLLANKDTRMSNPAKVFSYGTWIQGHSSFLGKLMAAGTGAKAIVKEISQSNFQINNVRGVDYQLLCTMGILSSMLVKEAGSLETLNQHFGFGYELIKFNNGKFQKISDYTFALLYTRPDEPNKIIPSYIMHYQYDNEILILTSVSMYRSTIEETTNYIRFKTSNIQTSRYIITPVDINREDIQVEKYRKNWSFNTERVSIGFLYATKKGAYTPCISAWAGIRCFFHEDSQMILEIEKQVFGVLLRTAKEGLKTAISNRRRNI